MTNIIIISLLALIAIVSPLLSVYMRRQRFNTPDEEHEKKPVSIILCVQDNAQDIENNMSAFLEQEYEPGYEVIVVCAKSEDDTEDVLKRFAGNPRLYTTFIPDSSRYISRRKLAMTLGVKAAHNPWILFTDITCRPTSSLWIKTMTERMSEGKNIVIGPVIYDEESPLFYRFQRLHDDISLAHEAAFSTAYRSECNNILMLRNEFLEGRGFEGNLKYMRGEYDFIVNKYAVKGGTAITNDPEALLVEAEPTRKMWRNHRLYYMETRRHLSRKIRHRLPLVIDGAFFILSLLLPLIAITLALFNVQCSMFNVQSSMFNVQSPTLIAAPAALLLTIIIRTLIARRRLRQFMSQIPAWKIVPLEIRLLWHKFHYWIAYRKADKYDFITHKI